MKHDFPGAVHPLPERATQGLDLRDIETVCDEHDALGQYRRLELRECVLPRSFFSKRMSNRLLVKDATGTAEFNEPVVEYSLQEFGVRAHVATQQVLLKRPQLLRD